MSNAIYPGSFDPITNGHINIIERISNQYDEVIVAVLNNKSKTSPLFTIDERVEMIQQSCSHLKNVKAMSFSGLLVDFAKKMNCNSIIRGLRAVSDFEMEMQMALVNKELDSTIETLFLVASGEYAYLSSSIVRELAEYNGNFSSFVSLNVEKKLREKFN